MRRAAVLCLLSLLLAGSAEAAKKKPASSGKSGRRYGVVATGPSAAAAVKAASTALKAVQVPDNRLADTAQRYGMQLGTDGAYQALAVDMKLDGVLRISTFEKPGGAVAVVQVRDGASGAVVDDATWKAPSPKALGQTLTKQLKSRFGRSLSRTRAPPPGTLPPPSVAAGGVAAVAAAPASRAPAGNAPAVSAAPQSVAPPGSDAPPLPTGVAPPLPTATAQPDPGVVGSAAPETVVHRESERPSLDIAVGAEVLNRNFTYKDDLFGVLQGYSLGAAIAPLAEVTWSPLGGRLAFSGHIAMTVGLKSQISNDTTNTTYPSQSLSWGGGVAYRFLIGEKSHLGLGVRYESQSFSISANDAGNRPDIPDVHYSALAMGLDLRLSLFGPVSLLAAASYRQLFGVGDVGSAAWFPRQSSRGVDGMIGFGVELGRSFEIRVQAQVQRYGFSFNPEPGDAHVAGGATDTFFSGSAVLAFRL